PPERPPDACAGGSRRSDTLGGGHPTGSPALSDPHPCDRQCTDGISRSLAPDRRGRLAASSYCRHARGLCRRRRGQRLLVEASRCAVPYLCGPQRRLGGYGRSLQCIAGMVGGSWLVVTCRRWQTLSRHNEPLTTNNEQRCRQVASSIVRRTRSSVVSPCRHAT